jgi:hypothetical protein
MLSDAGAGFGNWEVRVVGGYWRALATFKRIAPN